MTTIIIRKDNNNAYKGFICMGHAEYARKRLFGKSPDILCSAISVLVISTINSLEELAGEKLSVASNEETGFIKCDFEGILQEKSIFLMDSMVFSLENLSKKYGEQYLQVKFEEV
ncbi:MAG: ribosomal-processing cysteine protease Prp [Lachnospiraceae bacterium]|nr:ribosomal-processing cysteine protease Prp [Lachnospiraceae bacterium]